MLFMEKTYEVIKSELQHSELWDKYLKDLAHIRSKGNIKYIDISENISGYFKWHWPLQASKHIIQDRTHSRKVR